MKRTVVTGAALFVLLGGSAFAMPGQEQSQKQAQKQPQEQSQEQSQKQAQEHIDRFKTMDSNGDGLLMWSEFEAAMPQMRKEAFDSIDTDKNGAITPAEWEKFSKTHGMKKGMKGGMKAPDQTAPAPGTAPAKPLIQPPAK